MEGKIISICFFMPPSTDRSLTQPVKLAFFSFQCVGYGSECDLRFVYCACAICYILGDWSGVDKDAMLQYIQSCRTYDGALSLVPNQESHGGSTYCGIASLALMGELDQVFLHFDGWKEDLVRWCVSRQMEGMQGRPNKLEDTCYSYWIGATLKILDCEYLLDRDVLRCFVMGCQSGTGGFSKVRDEYHPPDLLHSFYSLAWLSFSRKELHPIDCMLGMSSRHFDAFRRNVV
jgi:Prenyltransferase, beta subunit